MSFISLQEYREKHSQQVARRSATNRVAYIISGYEYKGNKKFVERVTFTITGDICAKAGFKEGDYLNLVYEPKTHEGYLQAVENGGWKLSSVSKTKNPLKSLKVTFPYPDILDMPKFKSQRTVPSFHVSPMGLVFNLSKLVSGEDNGK